MFLRTLLAGSLAVCGVVATAVPAPAAQSLTPSAAVAAAKRAGDCPDCRYSAYPSSARAAASARRGLVDVVVTDPSGGGAHMFMGYTGSVWKPITAGNGDLRGPSELPAKITICMNAGGWTVVRSGPGTGYRALGKVTRPTITRAFQLRLTKAMTDSTEGIGWYRITYQGRRAWVQNRRMIATGTYGGSAAADCQAWRQFAG